MGFFLKRFEDIIVRIINTDKLFTLCYVSLNSISQINRPITLNHYSYAPKKTTKNKNLVKQTSLWELQGITNTSQQDRPQQAD